MSGHSKWSTIRHKKAAEDAKKGAAFTKVAKKIYIAVKQGKSGDIEKNPSLRMVVEEAKSVNMPNDNIRKAIDRALGIGGSGKEFEVTYEGYLAGGVGVMVSVLTDNKNRTGGEIKLIFDRAGGSMSGPGSVAYLQQLDPRVLIDLTREIREQVNQTLLALLDMDEVVSVWANIEGYDKTE